MKSITHAGRNTVSSEDKVMNPEQFERVMTAIMDGKYSWACVLILRFAGYNPAHYIPYRTYKRLIKSNRTVSNSESSKMPTAKSNQRSLSASVSSIRQPSMS